MASALLERVYASGGPEIIIATLEIYSSAWPEPVLICTGYDDVVAFDENGIERVFEASGFDATRPKVDSSGGQTITFAVNNANGIIQQLTDAAMNAGVQAGAIFREYLSTDLSAPSATPYRMVVTGGKMKGITAEIECGYFDLINTKWPRRKYTLNRYPCLRYI